MNIGIRSVGRVLIFDIGAEARCLLGDELPGIVEAASRRTSRVILNLGELRSINSRIIKAVSSARRLLAAAGGDMVLINLSESVRKTLSVLRFDRIMRTGLSEKEAVEYLAGLKS